MSGFIVTGTDTGIGKTVVAAMLTMALEGVYFKPVQSGATDETDRQQVLRVTGLGLDRVFNDGVTLSMPLSPHRAAELDGVEIDAERLRPPVAERPVIVEGAGGVLVPITRELLQIELFKAWGLPVLLCARTGLGTINHTLLSIEALRARALNLRGVVLVGEDNPDNARTIAETGRVKVLGRVPVLETIDAAALQQTFAQNFTLSDFGERT